MLDTHRFSLLLLAGFLGCASAPSSSGSVANPPRLQVITLKEIDDYGLGGTVYDLVSKLRPNFLSSRGQTSIFGGTSQVGEIRFYQAAEAERKFGPGNSSGVIAITTRR